MRTLCAHLAILAFIYLVPLAAAQPVSATDSTKTVPSSVKAEASHPLAAFAANGSSFAESIHLGELGWSEEQFAAFIDGMRMAYHGKVLPLDEAARRLQSETLSLIENIQTRAKQQLRSEFSQPGRLQQYMKEMCKNLGLQESASGLAYGIQPGRPGVRPGPNDTVVVSCTATAADGKTPLPQLSFDGMKMKMSGLLPGFAEGFQMMTVDSKAVFVVPPDLSFGNGEWPEGVASGTPLVFRIVLHEVISAETAP